MKKIILLLCMMLAPIQTGAITLDELTAPAAQSQRLGTEDVPEKVFKIVWRYYNGNNKNLEDR